MGDTFKRILWFAVVAVLAAYATYLFLGRVVNAESDAQVKTVVVRDIISQRMHILSGMVMVPSACHKLIARVKEIDIENYLLNFRIWEDPNRTCPMEEEPQRFNMTLFAPSAGIAFQGTLDDVPIPIEVIPTIAP